MKAISIEDLVIDYEILAPSEKLLIEEAADVLAETFIGFSTCGHMIREPMCYAIEIQKDDFRAFVLDYLHAVTEQGYCFIAKDRASGKVVGAYACEIFNPDEEELPIFEGSFEPFNQITELLANLDTRFIETLIHRTGRQPGYNEYLHAFLLGVRTDKNRKEIANQLIEMSLIKAENEGLLGCFLEATSSKSQGLLQKYFEFYLPTDTFGEPILTKFSETEAFKNIPENIGVNCQILYKPLNGTIKI